MRWQKYTLTNRWVSKASDARYAKVLPISLLRIKFSKKYSLALMRIDGEIDQLTPKPRD